jgi:hypothetical protein
LHANFNEGLASYWNPSLRRVRVLEGRIDLWHWKHGGHWVGIAVLTRRVDTVCDRGSPFVISHTYYESMPSWPCRRIGHSGRRLILISRTAFGCVLDLRLRMLQKDRVVLRVCFG